MGIPKTYPAVSLGSQGTAGPRTPAVSGPVIVASTVAWAKGICTIVLGSALPTDGYNGPRGYGNAGPDLGTAGQGQEVTLWGFSSTVGLLLNGKTVTVLDNNPAASSFRFYFSGGSTQAATSDTGNTAASPFEHFRTIRIEVDAGNSSDIIYVGDLNVSSTQYVAALSLQGQLSVELASENEPGDRIWLWANNTSASDVAHISTIY